MFGKLKKLISSSGFLYWQFAALNFTLVLVLGLLGFKLGYLSKDKLIQISKVVMTFKKPEPKPELTDAEYDRLRTMEERSAWLRMSQQRVLAERERGLVVLSQRRSAIEQEKGLLESEQARLTTLKKTLTEERKMLEKDKKTWKDEVSKKGFLEQVQRYEAMDDATVIAQFLLSYPPKKMAQYISVFKSNYDGKVLKALQQKLEALGKAGIFEEVLRYLEHKN